VSDKEIVVRKAPNAKAARAAAEAFVASVSAATGRRAYLKAHKRNGKRYVGRELTSGYGMNMQYHEGWAFPYEVR
jgi:hypothetical protein